jgi:hypothetical protein
MNTHDVVEEIQRFIAKSITWIDLAAEPIVIEGIAYVWQRNNEWSDEYTATIIAMLLGNFAPSFEEAHDSELYENPF